MPRRVLVLGVRFGHNEWHPGDQWLLRGFDLDKRAIREFAISDISRVDKDGSIVE